MPNLVKYCVDCFFSIVLCSDRVGYVSGCISLRLVGGFLRGVVVLCTIVVLCTTERSDKKKGDGLRRMKKMRD